MKLDDWYKLEFQSISNPLHLMREIFGHAIVADITDKEVLAIKVDKILIETMYPKEMQVLRARFGDDPLTLQAIGDIVGVGRERVRTVQEKALRKMRHPSRSGSFKEHLIRVTCSFAE